MIHLIVFGILLILGLFSWWVVESDPEGVDKFFDELDPFNPDHYRSRRKRDW